MDERKGPNQLISEVLGESAARRSRSGRQLGGAALRADEFSSASAPPVDLGDRSTRMLIEEEALRRTRARPQRSRRRRFGGLAGLLGLIVGAGLLGGAWLLFRAHERDLVAAKLRVAETARRRFDEEQQLELRRRAKRPKLTAPTR
ncbi:MAG: hypothetical protein ACYCWW_16370 [Deltaproteobacteria bacterium]